MYKRNIPHLPEKINRCEFVNIIFDIGLEYQHGYDTLMIAVEIGDYFVSYDGPRESLMKKSSKNMIRNPAPQEYSKELAYVTTVIAAKYNEDNGYDLIENATIDTENSYVRKMEWEICMILGFTIKNRNFITLIGSLSLVNPPKLLGSMFWDLIKDICMNQSLMKINPITILLGCFLLHKRGKLRAFYTNKVRNFMTIMTKTAYIYDVPLSNLLKNYCLLKRGLLETPVVETKIDTEVNPIPPQIMIPNLFIENNLSDDTSQENSDTNDSSQESPDMNNSNRKVFEGWFPTLSTQESPKLPKK